MHTEGWTQHSIRTGYIHVKRARTRVLVKNHVQHPSRPLLLMDKKKYWFNLQKRVTLVFTYPGREEKSLINSF